MRRSQKNVSRAVVALAVVGSAAAGPVGATASPVACGQVITSDVVLTADLNCVGQSGLTIGAGGVTIDLAGHSINDAGISIVGPVQGAALTNVTFGTGRFDEAASSSNTPPRSGFRGCGSRTRAPPR